MEKLYTWSRNKNKMIIDTDFKEFNKQTNYIGTGNCIANTQYSSYIRPINETTCNGCNFPANHLQNYDLKGFAINSEMRNILKNQTESTILYEFYIHKNKRVEIIGHLLINKQGATIYKKLYDTFSLNS